MYIKNLANNIYNILFNKCNYFTQDNKIAKNYFPFLKRILDIYFAHEQLKETKK